MYDLQPQHRSTFSETHQSYTTPRLIPDNQADYSKSVQVFIIVFIMVAHNHNNKHKITKNSLRADIHKKKKKIQSVQQIYFLNCWKICIELNNLQSAIRNSEIIFFWFALLHDFMIAKLKI